MKNEMKSKFASAALATFDLANFFKGLRADKAIQAMILEFDDELGLNESKVINQRFEYFKIKGSTPECFTERIFQITKNKFVKAGIRHISGNVDQPFISLWPSYSLNSLQDVCEVYQLIEDSFKVFEPKHLKLWLNPSLQFSNELSKSIEPCQRYIVAPLANLKAREKPRKYDEISLTQVGTEDYRSWYEALYKDFHAENTELKDWVPINDKEDMNDCLKDDLLFFINIGGVRAGIIGGTREDLLGMPGVYFTEILLAGDFKGQGYAPAAQRHLIELLPDTIEVIWGTIDSKNISSTKTALRVGRVPIRSEFFVPTEQIIKIN